MADESCKKCCGANINSSSEEEEEERVRLRQKCVEKTASLDIGNGYRRELTTEELINRFDMDQYGSTPPRTRIKNKNRDWDQRKQQKLSCDFDCRDAATKAIRGISRMARSRASRRNTLDCALLNEIFIDDDTKKSDKRSMQLLRESERDLKLASGIIYPTSGSPTLNTSPSKTASIAKNVTIQTAYDERSEIFPSSNRMCVSNNLSVIPKLIETGNRYMSVASRQVGCRSSAPAQAFTNKECSSIAAAAFAAQQNRSNVIANTVEKPFLQPRQEFHETFANLIKLGSTDKQDAKLSSEDHIWQTELKDMIWLELQAWHADRTLEQQDKYLYSARQGIPDLLNKISNYRFTPRFEREISVSSTDSGVSVNSQKSQFSNPPEVFTPEASQKKRCSQCYSMYCKDCQDQQTIALREIEELLTRLEAAEALYPSSKVLGDFHPEYKSPKFVGRVKAMCLWYNITRHQRLKLLIVGKIFARLQGKPFHWPLSDKPNDSSASSSIQENDDSGRDSIDSKKVHPPRIPKVKFTCDGDSSSSPSDSTSSIDSMRETQNCSLDAIDHQNDLNMTDYQDIFKHVDLYNVNSISGIDYSNAMFSPYRKYIEHVLKSRGLGQSLSFLHRLHNVVLRKAHATLEKPGQEESDLDFDGFDGELQTTEIPLSKEHEDELHSYGIWSEEAASLNLPSYVPAFVFLSIMPLEVMHEYLRMRLESKPVRPNPLSLEQLMKELREGLILAMTHRERFSRHIHTAFLDKETELEKYTTILENYDSTVKKVLDVYSEYVEQWVLVAAPEGHRKNALDKEWMFSKLICPMIPGQHANVAKKFCQIVSDLLQITGNRLINRSQDLEDQINEERTNANEEDKKWQILTVCREIQALFTLEREKTMRLMSFAKSLCRDIETADFHRDHECDGKDFVCQVVKDAVTTLQKDVLSVRHKLTKIIERVQQRCDVKYLNKMEEADKISILSRAREILHQGYKFGFEYHKDIVRLFETKIVSCKDKSCEFNLSLGIINFAKMWMQFVTERCERGRGVRPRWATLGLEFLIAACDPSNTRHLSDEEFDDLKTRMDNCISHVVGIGTEPEKIRKRTSPRSRKISPGTNRALTPTRTLSPRISADHRAFMNSMSVREEMSPSQISAPSTPELVRKQTSCDQVDNHAITGGGTLLRVPKMSNFGPALRQIRVRDETNRLDSELDKKLRDRKLIGQVKTLDHTDKIQIRARSVNFRWHRGIKIGQGRFGKVYTAVNNSTGELMAMKEIAIQPGETKAIRNVAEELKIFEGISHRHLVKLYGVEIHREELLIFMELCSEGTLESLVEMSNGLFEGLTRRYAAQLLDAVTELHKHGVVHRDIKPANIFLTKSGNCLKLGDFGSAVKIQAHTTIPGELQGYVGTQAYMAPEVFTRNHTDGHGRAADIWSVGCVVIEMASGKRPWAQFDSNFQIMFKVGMGESPEIPDKLSDEGQEFLDYCLKHDPGERWLATELLEHPFCKVDFHDDASTENENHND